MVRRYREEHWTNAELLLVAVGYSSTVVRDLLGTQMIAVQFNEKSFAGELRTHIVTLSTRLKDAPAAESVITGEAYSKFDDNLRQISTRLSELETTRMNEAVRIQQRYASKNEALSQSNTEERKVATRREALDAIELLSEAIRFNNTLREREIMRSILVANEAYLHNSALEELGDLYMEVLALERLWTDEVGEYTWARKDGRSNAR